MYSTNYDQCHAKAVAELHPLVWYGSSFTTLSWVGHVLYIDNNEQLF